MNKTSKREGSFLLPKKYEFSYLYSFASAIKITLKAASASLIASPYLSSATLHRLKKAKKDLLS